MPFPRHTVHGYDRGVFALTYDLTHDEGLVEEPSDLDPLASFLADGTISEVLGELKSGKEGTVYCCRANPATGVDLIAAKVFRAREHRTFRDDSVYREGFFIGNRRDERALKKKTAWGHRVQSGSWMFHEYETLKSLSGWGADVPRPIAMGERVILMQFVGDAENAAPKLQETRLDPAEARPLFQRIMANIELFLRENLIHGDLSPYNILYWQGGISIIDFPQAVDPRFNAHALDLLTRDVSNICRHFARYGVQTDPQRLAGHLWGRFLRSDL